VKASLECAARWACDNASRLDHQKLEQPATARIQRDQLGRGESCHVQRDRDRSRQQCGTGSRHHLSRTGAVLLRAMQELRGARRDEWRIRHCFGQRGEAQRETVTHGVDAD